VLVVEITTWCAGAGGAAERGGWPEVLVSGGRRGGDHAVSQAPADITLMDLRLPRMAGDVIQRLRMETPGRVHCAHDV